MNTITTPNGKTYEVMSRQSLDGMANLQRSEPNTSAYLFVSERGRAFLVREMKDGTRSNAVRL